ncbi:hypothetical protein AGMMS50293_05740 [Spirochaetia bacterium]|nr:hypothetical protein AGMMS50293_05740 [Spirochaetia bacterium]
MFNRKNQTNPDNFWREYEEKTGEQVLARSLGQYISGWEEFDRQGWKAIWGLVIATSGGFRFHHFPHMGWIEALTHLNSGAEPPKEKTLFLPRDKIISAKLIKETRWWKKLLTPSTPRLVICYHDDAGEERTMVLETEYKSEGLAEKLSLADSVADSGEN